MRKRIADNVIPLTTPLDISFFRAWLDFTEPLHNLTSKEKAVMAVYLNEHYELSKVITDDAILAQVLSSTSVRQKVMKHCKLKASNLQVVLYKFKKAGLMSDGKISPKLIPAITEDVKEDKEFRLMIRFSIEDEHKDIDN